MIYRYTKALLVVPSIFFIFFLIIQPASLHTKFSCSENNTVCNAFLNVLKPLYDASYDYSRNNIPKKNFPILNIYLSDGSLNKLHAKRQKTLESMHPILLSEKDDWVKAKILVDEGGDLYQVKSLIRLKGDWADHLKNSKKLSFRVKVKNGYILGMSKFSLQDPSARNYQSESLINLMMRKLGVIGPRYVFVDLRINDYRVGVMALEEHYTKELLESQERRAAPILAFEEDLMWRQRDLNLNHSGFSINKWIDEFNVHPHGVHYSLRDYPTKQFKQKKLKLGTIKSNNTIKGGSILRDYLDGNRDGIDTFDLDLLSKWWILVNIWNAPHGAIDHNKRFYFNPITGYLEPVSFDNEGDPDEFKFIMDDVVSTVMSRPEFLENVLNNLRLTKDLLNDESFIKEFNDQQDFLIMILKDLEGIEVEKVGLETLKVNLISFAIRFNESINNTSLFKESMSQYDGVNRIQMLELNTPLHSHLRSFLFFNYDKYVASIKNLTLKEISINRVYAKNKKSERTIFTQKVLSPYNSSSSNLHKIEFGFEKTKVFGDDDYYVDYTFEGGKFTSPLTLQFMKYDEGLTILTPGTINNKIPSAKIDKDSMSVIFNKGVHNINSSIEIPRDWQVSMLPGAILNMKDGALIRINGPIKILGTKKKPVNINIESNDNFLHMGSWGGILVVDSKRDSVVNNLVVRGVAGSQPSNRQDYYGLTGCVTFYNSNVAISNAIFKGLQCEDSLNIVKSKFNINHMRIFNSASDSFDSDFSEGIVSNSTVKDSGNDGYDFSGSRIKLIDIDFENIGDKAISAGEKTNLNATNINILGASIGVASKDLSKVILNRVNFDQIIGSGLITYIKKNEYGPSSIDCSGCSFSNTGSIATNQIGSSINLNGKVVNPKVFNKNNLKESGYVE
jgi:hypothetical protein